MRVPGPPAPPAAALGLSTASADHVSAGAGSSAVNASAARNATAANDAPVRHRAAAPAQRPTAPGRAGIALAAEPLPHSPTALLPGFSGTLASPVPQRGRRLARRPSDRAAGLATAAVERRPAPLTSENDCGEAPNSDDELPDMRLAASSNDDTAAQREREKLFERSLRKAHGFVIRRVKADGACLFRAAADQVYGDEDAHGHVRRDVVDHIRRERDHYSQFITEDFASYVLRKSQARTFGNNIEIQALTEVYGRSVEVYRYGTDPLYIFVPLRETLIPGAPPIRLSYHRGNHYNSVRQPLVDASANIPFTLSEHLHLVEALSISERQETEQSLLEESRQLEDMERTEDEMAAAAVAASLLELSLSGGSASASGCASMLSPVRDRDRIPGSANYGGSVSPVLGSGSAASGFSFLANPTWNATAAATGALYGAPPRRRESGVSSPVQSASRTPTPPSDV